MFAVLAVSCKPVTGDNDDDPGGIRITKFVIDGVEGVINQTEKTIEVALPPKTNLTALLPEVEFFGASIAPAIGETVDFAAVEPVEYTLLSKDGSATYYSVTVTTAPDADVSLKSLTVDGSSLSPAFSKGTYTYDVTVYTDTIKVTAAANDANAKLTYVENNNAEVSSGTAFTSKTLSEGANTVTVKVTAENGTDAKSYTLNVKPFVTVPGGSFEMGSNSGYDNETPVHRVTLNTFSIAKYEVTQKEWKELMGTDPSNFKGDNLPVEQVSWFEAVEYCNKLSLKEGLTPAYVIDKSQSDPNNGNIMDMVHWLVTWDRNANGYRLPTEAEWEYAARGGNGSPGDYEYAGSNTVNDVAWYNENSDSKTHEVGGKDSNGLGLYDMSGNVWEWCWDWYDFSSYSSGAQIDPVGPSSGGGRVRRGGGWGRSAANERSAHRSSGSSTGLSNDLGFRLVRP